MNFDPKYAINPKILVADEDPDAVFALIRYLKKLGFQNINTAGNGREAMDKLQSMPFDMVFLDRHMPELDGFEVLEKMKQDESLRNIPVIMISGDTEMQSVVKGIELGAEDYLPKPIQEPILSARINSLMAKIHVRRTEEFSQKFLDPLTDLPNKALLLDRIESAINDAAKVSRLGVLIYLGQYDIAVLRSLFGMCSGDELMVKMAQTLKNHTRMTDTVASMPNGEFALFLAGVPETVGAEKVVRSVAKRLRKPIEINHEDHQLLMNMGVAAFPANGNTSDELLDSAHTALMKAQEQGKGEIVFFDAEIRDQIKKRAAIDSALRGALERAEISMNYQPLVSSTTGLVTGAEALMRWNPAGLGPVSPVDFIPIAEESNLIVDLGRFALEQAVQDISTLNARLQSSLTVSVNVSVKQLLADGFVSMVREVLEANGFPPKNLMVEITESVLIERFDTVITLLQALRDFGVGVSLDDFGVGFSSLSYINKLPMTQMKIDRTFINTMDESDEDMALVRSIISIGKGRGLAIVAEGVENQNQVAELVRHGCHYFQGYVFSKPLALQELERYVSRRRERSKGLAKKRPVRPVEETDRQAAADTAA